MQQQLQQVEAQEEEILVEVALLAPIHQVQEEVENGKNNKEYPKRYGRPSMDPSWYVYCLGRFGR
jgi:hypothetical protein